MHMHGCLLREREVSPGGRLFIIRIEKNGGAGSKKNYNKINSLGKKYDEQDKTNT
jgi:hypothetical protein